MSFRVGLGYDVHRLVAGRKLVLGGVEIPHPLGLEGHSDADVLLHALGDALLGAASLGDLGQHFPSGDPQWKGVSSARLLDRILELIRSAGYRVVNADLTVVAEEPRLTPYRERIRERIAELLSLAPQDVGLKATTQEGLGFLGRREGIVALAVVLLEREG